MSATREPAVAAGGAAAERGVAPERVDRWARRVVDAGLGRPALFLILAHLPLSTFAAHAALVLDPFVKAIFGLRADTIHEVLADRRILQALADRIEDRLNALPAPEARRG